jgi:23S rRNA (pseudouridine1915-N3)-methyltransferase
VARLHVVALDARLPAWAEQACAEYAKRMPKGYQVARSGAVPKKIRTVALDERGKDLTTVQFSELLKTETAFVIGGPDGLDSEVKANAFMLLRLSSLTLPHALAQVVLLEQIYRAATLLTGHPYHRA